MPRVSRSKVPKRPSRPKIDIDSSLRAAASAAADAVRAHPFGRGLRGRALNAVARNWSRSSRRVVIPRRGSWPARIAFAVLRAFVAAHAVFILSTSMLLFIFKSVNPAATTLMVNRHLVEGWEIREPRFVPLAKIPKLTRNMVIRVEDGNFFEHHGIMLSAIKYAYRLNKQFGEPIYGGSTITMQTARTLFLVPEKSYLRKYLEAIVALEMEAILGKQRILELYFNYAEWGKGVFGIEAASRYYYKAGVASLSRDRAIRLVTLLSSPIRHGPYSFGKNGILKSRYAYLDERFGAK
jgi:monofunctional biosynthetic peptidoglycan transglycosylase